MRNRLASNLFLASIAAMVGVAACGDNENPAEMIDAPVADARPDARGDAPVVDAPDAPPGIDAMVDAGVDAMIDAPGIDAMIDAPGIDAPMIDAPGIDAPMIDAPMIDAPMIDAMIDAPGLDAMIDAPMIDAPMMALGDHLLITEVKTVDASEFIEIYNPTNATIDLRNYYVTDMNDYWKYPGLVAGNATLVTDSTDFVARFPVGATIAPRQVITVAMDAVGFEAGLLTVPTYTVQELGNSTAMEVVVQGRAPRTPA